MGLKDNVTNSHSMISSSIEMQNLKIHEDMDQLNSKLKYNQTHTVLLGHL